LNQRVNQMMGDDACVGGTGCIAYHCDDRSFINGRYGPVVVTAKGSQQPFVNLQPLSGAELVFGVNDDKGNLYAQSQLVVGLRTKFLQTYRPQSCGISVN
jgi:hypothetical protein